MEPPNPGEADRPWKQWIEEAEQALDEHFAVLQRGLLQAPTGDQGRAKVPDGHLTSLQRAAQNWRRALEEASFVGDDIQARQAISHDAVHRVRILGTSATTEYLSFAIAILKTARSIVRSIAIEEMYIEVLLLELASRHASGRHVQDADKRVLEQLQGLRERILISTALARMAEEFILVWRFLSVSVGLMSARERQETAQEWARISPILLSLEAGVKNRPVLARACQILWYMAATLEYPQDPSLGAVEDALRFDLQRTVRMIQEAYKESNSFDPSALFHSRVDVHGMDELKRRMTQDLEMTAREVLQKGTDAPGQSTTDARKVNASLQAMAARSQVDQFAGKAEIPPVARYQGKHFVSLELSTEEKRLALAVSESTVLAGLPRPLAQIYAILSQDLEPMSWLVYLAQFLEITLKYLASMAFSCLVGCLVEQARPPGHPEWGSVESHADWLPGLPKSFDFLLSKKPATAGVWLGALRGVLDEMVQNLYTPGENRLADALAQRFRQDRSGYMRLSFLLVARNKLHGTDREAIAAAQPRIRVQLELLLKELSFLQEFPLCYVDEVIQEQPPPAESHYLIVGAMGVKESAYTQPTRLYSKAPIDTDEAFILSLADRRLWYLYPLWRIGRIDASGRMPVLLGYSRSKQNLTYIRYYIVGHGGEYPTDHHIYSSAALLADFAGRLRSIVVPDCKVNQSAIARLKRRRPPISGQIGNYRIHECLVQTHHSDIYAVKETEGEEGNIRILKMLAGGKDPRMQLRFEQEIALLELLKADLHVVRILEKGECEESGELRYYYVMEYAAKGDLNSFLPFCLQEDLPACFRSVVLCVEALHGQKIVHRDVKPDNILVFEDGSIRICDFGAAKQISTPTMRADRKESAPEKTEAYAAPEQLEGRPDVSYPADVYALGIMLYKVATGDALWSSRIDLDVEEGRSTLEKKAGQFLSALPKPLRNVILRCTQVHPADRYPTAHELRSDVDALPPFWGKAGA